jgi:tetratricopeptide (TPR) repeat protein
MKKITCLIVLITLGSIVLAQTSEDKTKAVEYGMEAIKIMDAGQLDESIVLLEKAQKLDPARFDYPYEIAYALNLKTEYSKCLEVAVPLLNHKDATDRVYQLVGNTYDMIKQPEKAFETYAAGREKFPSSGKLYLEPGIIENARGNYNEAIRYWEQGVKVDPNFSSNYYWLAKIFSSTDEKIWSILYGEIFMTLEYGSKRTEEISKLLFQNYRNSYKPATDSSGEFQLTKKGFEIVIGTKKDMKKLKKGILPFEGTFATVFSMSALEFIKGIDIKSINLARNSFVNLWFSKYDQQYANALLEFQKRMLDAGVFEAYNYWLVSQGDGQQFDVWHSVNKIKFDQFAEWFKANRIKLKSDDQYARVDYY